MKQIVRQGLWFLKSPKHVLLATAILFLIIIFQAHQFPIEPSVYATDDEALLPAQTEASRLSPQDLMSRRLIGAAREMPKIYHQSWSSNELPAKFEQWSQGCRERHADWEWVLWTDDDNLELVKKFVPWLLPAWDKLPGPIYRADLVRNLYMFLFGG
jgi:mannosyltransferase OCH1-like enzyme